MALYAVTLLLAALIGSLQSAHAVQRSKEKTYGQVRDDKALVYFVRSPDWGRGVDSLLYLFSDNEFLGLLSKNSYTFVQLDPGLHYLWHSAAVREKANADLASTRELGPTCDGTDVCLTNEPLPENLAAGDFLYIRDHGAYSTACATMFNGFPIPDTIIVPTRPSAL